jgi:hypothetical protein
VVVPIVHNFKLPTKVEVPEFALNIPILDLQLFLTITNEQNAKVGCGVAMFGSDKSLFQTMIVGFNSIVVGVSALSTIATTMSSSQAPAFASTGVLFMTQFIAMTGMFNVNYPPFYAEFASGFVWTQFIVAPGLRGSKNETTAFDAAVAQNPSASPLVKRSWEAVKQLIPAQSFHLVKRQQAGVDPSVGMVPGQGAVQTGVQQPGVPDNGQLQQPTEGSQEVGTQRQGLDRMAAVLGLDSNDLFLACFLTVLVVCAGGVVTMCITRIVLGYFFQYKETGPFCGFRNHFKDYVIGTKHIFYTHYPSSVSKPSVF